MDQGITNKNLLSLSRRLMSRGDDCRQLISTPLWGGWGRGWWGWGPAPCLHTRKRDISIVRRGLLGRAHMDQGITNKKFAFSFERLRMARSRPSLRSLREAR